MAILSDLEYSIKENFVDDVAIRNYIRCWIDVERILRNAQKIVSFADVDGFEVLIQKPFGNDSKYFRVFTSRNAYKDWFDYGQTSNKIYWAFIEDFDLAERRPGEIAIEFEYSVCTADEFNSDYSAFFENHLYDEKECFSDDFRILVLKFKPVGY